MTERIVRTEHQSARWLANHLAREPVLRTVRGVDPLDELTRRLLLLHEQMEQLVCALDIQQLVIANNRLRWLPAVTENVEMLVDEIKLAETQRLQVSRSAADALGVPQGATLAELADAVGEPYRSSWRRTRLQLQAFHQEINLITTSSQELSRQGVVAAGEVITTLGAADEPTAYSSSGRTEAVRPASHRFDRTA